MTNNLSRYRIAHGMTQIELAERANLSVTWISHLETGRKTAAPDATRRIAEVLGVAASELGICPELTAPIGFADVAVLGILLTEGLEWGVKLQAGLGYVRIAASDGDLVGYRVEMDMGRLKNGDLVFAAPGATPNAGAVVVATHPGAGTQIRRFAVLESGVRVLRSLAGGPDVLADGWRIDAVVQRVMMSADAAF